MYAQVEKSKENKSRAVANSVAQNKSNGKQGFGFVDNRPGGFTQRKLQGLDKPITQAKGAVFSEYPKLKISTDVLGAKIFQMHCLENSKYEPPHGKVTQFYVSESLHGESHPEVLNERFKDDDFASSGANRGLIKIGVPTGHELEGHAKFYNGIITLHGKSTYGVEHAEENLYAQAKALGVDFGAHPNDLTALRVTSLHTERAPCDEFNADRARAERNQGNCTSYLQGLLHQVTPVSHSVANNNNDFNMLMLKGEVQKRKLQARSSVAQHAAQTLKDSRDAYNETNGAAPAPELLDLWRAGLYQLRDQQFALIMAIEPGLPANAHNKFEQISTKEDIGITALNEYEPLA